MYVFIGSMVEQVIFKQDALIQKLVSAFAVKCFEDILSTLWVVVVVKAVVAILDKVVAVFWVL